MQTANNGKKKPPRFLALTGIAFQMGLTIYLFALLGKYIDRQYNIEEKYATISLTLIGVAISFYNLLKQVNKLNRQEDEESDSSI